MSKTKGSGCGCALTLVIAAVAGLLAASQDPKLGLFIFIGIAIVGMIIVAASSSQKKMTCDICSSPIRKKYYEVEINDVRKSACPHCYSSIERKLSKAATDRLFSKKR